MPQRIDAGPALAALGALLLAVSLFLDWFELGGASVTGWGAFEALDLLLFGLALAALALAATRIGADGAGDARLLPALGAVAVFVVAVQVLDPPPAVDDAGADVAEGAWLALAGGLLLALGGLLAAASISVVVTVAGRDTRRRVPAVDRRRRRPAAEAAAERPAGERPAAERPAAGPAEDATADAPARPAGAGSLFAEGGPDDQRTQAFDVADLQEPRERGRRGPTGG